MHVNIEHTYHLEKHLPQERRVTHSYIFISNCYQIIHIGIFLILVLLKIKINIENRFQLH